MADITMCHGGSCKIKELCYRHVATPGMRQSFFIKPPVDESGYKCKYFWKVDRLDEPKVEGYER